MKKRMHKALERAGWTLAAAGTLALTGQAQAQRPGNVSGVRTVQVQPSTGQVTPALESDSYSRLIEMRIALAWLADPVTFPCRLTARVDGAAVEVRGFVPSEAVR